MYKSSVIGGTVSEIGGGKFTNGAITAAYVTIFNQIAHSRKLMDADKRKIFSAYPKGDEVTRDELYENIGGPLLDWYKDDPNALANTCAARLSVALNESGHEIPNGTAGTFKGSGGKNYFISVKAMTKYLTKTYGDPSTKRTGYKLYNAIIWQSDCNWSDATGHLDIIYRGKVGTKYYDVCGTIKFW